MIDLIRYGGLELLAGEAMPSTVASAAIFANAPVGTQLILLTLRTAGLTIRFDGNDPTAGANGQDYGATTLLPHEFMLNEVNSAAVRAINNGGVATGYISYFGVATSSF